MGQQKIDFRIEGRSGMGRRLRSLSMVSRSLPLKARAWRRHSWRADAACSEHQQGFMSHAGCTVASGSVSTA